MLHTLCQFLSCCIHCVNSCHVTYLVSILVMLHTLCQFLSCYLTQDGILIIDTRYVTLRIDKRYVILKIDTRYVILRIDTRCHFKNWHKWHIFCQFLKWHILCQLLKCHLVSVLVISRPLPQFLILHIACVSSGYFTCILIVI
jgi:hypothetical protein